MRSPFCGLSVNFKLQRRNAIGLINQHKNLQSPKVIPVTQNARRNAYYLVRNDGPVSKKNCYYSNKYSPPVTSSNLQGKSPVLGSEVQSVALQRNGLLVSTSLCNTAKPKNVLINPKFQMTDSTILKANATCRIQTSIEKSKISRDPDTSARPKTILVNPNFKGSTSVHINSKVYNLLGPGKKKNGHEDTTRSNITNETVPKFNNSLSKNASANTFVAPEKYLFKSNRKLVRDAANSLKISNEKPIPAAVTKSPLIAINNRKLVRMSTETERVISDIKVHKIPYKRSTTYYRNKRPTVFKKPIRHARINSRLTKHSQSPNSSKYKFLRGLKIKSPSSSKFRVDHRLPTAQLRVKNVNKYSLRYEPNTPTSRRRSWQNAVLTSKNRYRKISTSSQGSNKLSEFSIRGQKFLMDPQGKTLQRVTATPQTSAASTSTSPSVNLRRIHVAGVTYLAKAPNVYVRTNDHKTRTIVSQAKYKSISVLVNKLRKNNKPCVFYRRFGKCIRKEKGTCPCVHDPKQIAICKKFLQGKCQVKDCLLSHEVTPEKMPTCQYFLDGCCIREQCPYLHVKVNSRAEICRDFLAGYCANAKTCKKKHVNICPDFDKNGKCLRGKKCPYPHKVAQKTPHPSEVHPAARTSVKRPAVQDADNKPTVSECARYYLSTSSGDQNPERVEDSSEIAPLQVIKPGKRSKIGPLPAFIPL